MVGDGTNDDIRNIIYQVFTTSKQFQLSLILKIALQSKYPHFKDEETEAQRDYVTWPKPHKYHSV